jgi:hypothetical protein
MKPSQAVIRLSALVAVLALIVSGGGLFWPGDGAPFPFTTHRGQVAQVYGQGLYRNDTVFFGAGNEGTDTVMLVLGVPLLVLSLLLYRRGSLRGALLLVGTLGYMLYIATSYALGAVAYNDLFLVYVAFFSASLFAFILSFAAVDLELLQSRFSPRLPRRSPAVFLLASAVLTFLVWVEAPVTGLLSGEPPKRLDIYTTLFTNALDMAVIVPAVFLAGLLILRRAPLGYLMALSLLVLEAMLAPMIVVQTLYQVRAGVAFTPGEIIGPVAGFVTVAVLAVWFETAILRAISEPSRRTPA